MKIKIELETTEAETFSALEKLEYFGDRIRVMVHLRVLGRHQHLAHHARQPGARHRHDAIAAIVDGRLVGVADDAVCGHPAGHPQPAQRLQDHGVGLEHIDRRRQTAFVVRPE